MQRNDTGEIPWKLASRLKNEWRFFETKSRSKTDQKLETED